MRRRIRLTGRKQIPRSSIEIKVFEMDSGQKVASLSILRPEWFQSFPDNARLKLRLSESKFFETIDFGALGVSYKSCTEYLQNTTFSAPSCQLRVVASDGDSKGLLLGSTKTWTLQDNDEETQSSRKGILLFKPKNIAPLTWELQINDDDNPIVYIDERIPEPRVWAVTDPVFIGCVMPTIIREVFEEIFRDYDEISELEWVKDWLSWADFLMPGKPVPEIYDRDQVRKWIKSLQDSFCHKHKTLDQVLIHLKE